MATRRWQPGAAPTTEVWTLTVGGTVEADDVFTIAVGAKAVSVTAGSTTLATVATNIVAALDALDGDDYPEFAEFTAEADGADVVLTAATAGKPFTPVASTTEAGGGAADAQTFVAVQTTAATGPEFWDDAANWSGTAVPVNGDDVVIEHTDGSIRYGLDQSAVTLASLTIRQSFTGDIGLPEVNANGTEYHEYRATHLAVGATTATVGEGEGQGSGRIKLDFGSVQTALTVYNTGSPAETTLESLQWKGTHASNVVSCYGGSVAVAGYGGETATVLTLRVGGDAQVRCGPGVTLGTATNDGASLDVYSNTTTLNHLDGTTGVHGSATVGTLTIDAGTVVYLSSGTITTLSVGSDATIDFEQDVRARTVTNLIQLYQGASLLDGGASVTMSGGYKTNRCGQEDVTVRTGQNRTYTVT